MIEKAYYIQDRIMTAKAGVISHRLEPTGEVFPSADEIAVTGEIGNLNLISATLTCRFDFDFQRAME